MPIRAYDRFSPATVQGPYRVQDYLDLTEPEERCELLLGHFLMSPSPNVAHQVIVKATLDKTLEGHLSENSSFWIVTPRFAGGTVSGLDTLLSGVYIGMEPGDKGAPQREFVGLENPPLISSDTPGRHFVVTAGSLGSLDLGSPIYYRQLKAGQVENFKLTPDGKSVRLRIFINAPYDKYVYEHTRFWNASGISASLTAEGIKVTTESIIALLVGGVAIIRVGAATELEMKEKKARVEDAMNATKAAVEEGVVPGGGVAFLRSIDAVDAVEAEGDMAIGVAIVRRALEEPARQIANNAGQEGSVIVRDVIALEGSMGYNADTGETEDLVKAGVIDPAKVTKTALLNASSIAGLMLTTEAMVSEIKEKKDDMPMPPGGGMEGMGGMGGMM